MSAMRLPGPAPSASSNNFPGSDTHRLQFVNDGRYGNGRSWISSTVGKGWVTLELSEPTMIERIEWARDREAKYADRLALGYEIAVAVEAGKWRVVASSDDRMPAGSSAGDNRLTELLARRADLDKQLREAERAPTTYAGTFTTPEATHRLHRGDPMQKRELVAPAAVTVMVAL